VVDTFAGLGRYLSIGGAAAVRVFREEGHRRIFASRMLGGGAAAFALRASDRLKPFPEVRT